MTKAHFSISINAPREQVWNTLWNDDTYRQWTGVFSPCSHAVTYWKEGSKVLFLSADGGGMYSTIARKISNELMSFTHLGEVREGKEQPIDEKASQWSGATESYLLTERDGTTQLTVEMDVTEDHQQYSNDTFPKALEKVKELSEG